MNKQAMPEFCRVADERHMTQQKKFEITPEGVREFMERATVLHAAGSGKRFLIGLGSPPRYFVESESGRGSFTDLDEAVDFFNRLPREV